MPDALKMREEVLEAGDEICVVTIPISQFGEDGRLNEIRSGILLQISDLKFVVTAGHGLRDYLDSGRPIAFAGGQKGDPPVYLFDESIWVTKNEDIDLAFARLTDDTLAAMPKHYRFLRLTDLLLDTRVDSGFYLLVGYPSQRVTEEEVNTFRIDRWKLFTMIYDGDKLHKVERYDPDLHIVAMYPSDANAYDGGFVRPHGMSGCGLWCILNPYLATGITVENMKPMAIQNGWHKGHGYAKATWIRHVLKIIWEYYPEARGPMMLHGVRF